MQSCEFFQSNAINATAQHVVFAEDLMNSEYFLKLQGFQNYISTNLDCFIQLLEIKKAMNYVSNGEKVYYWIAIFVNICFFELAIRKKNAEIDKLAR